MSTQKSYKPSGIEWIGEIPEGWEVKKLFYFGEVNLGKMLTPEDKGGYVLKPYLRSQNIQSDRVDVSDVKEMWFTENELIRLRLRKDDLLLNEGGDVGRTCIWNGELEECYFQNSVNRVRFKNDLQKYFLYLSNLYHHMKYYDSIVNRVSIPHLTKEKLESVRFLRPPLNEQEQIVKYLDEKTTIIDKLISTKQRKVELLKEQRTTLINQVITKGLNPNLKMKDSGVEWIDEIPENWETSKLKYNGLFFSGYSFDSGDFLSEGEIRIIKISNIQNNGISWEDLSFVPNDFYEKHKNFIVNKGDLIFVLTRPIISTGIKICFYNEDYKVLLNQRNSVFRTNSNKLNRYFTYYLVRTTYFIEEFKQQLKETNQPNISSEQISNIRMFLPPLQEQEHIVEYLDKHTKEIDDLVSMEQNKIEILKEYRQSLISEVITGKIKVV